MVNGAPPVYIALPPHLSSTLQASASQVAVSLKESTGAWACYLALLEQPKRLLANSGGELPSWREIEGAGLARQVVRSRSPRVSNRRWPILALPLICDNRTIGAAILLFSDAAAIQIDRATASAWLAASALDSTRQIIELRLQAEEIEERARLREIQASRNLIRGVIDSVPMGLVLLDAEGMILATNRTLSGRFRREPAALVGTSYDTALGPWKDSPAARTFLTHLAERVRRTIDLPDGSQVLLEIASIPLLGSEGQPYQVVEVWEDITERVALQTQLVRVEKLAAIGQLAASIAHEVGNPLQAIQGFLALFLEQCEPNTPNQYFLQLAEEEIERIVHVLARLRDLYRPPADVYSRVHLNDLINSVLLLTGKQLERSRITTRRELDINLPLVYGVADQLKQVVLNLVLNAAEAMYEGGLLHLQTYIHADRGNGRAVVVAITDTGTGIPVEQLPYIFDGLHTTKERGMGLGLYTSKAIIERHMGRIKVQSTSGEGTTFSFMLPIGSEEPGV